MTESSTVGTQAMAFGPNDALATADANGAVYLWNTIAMRRVYTFSELPSSVSASGLAFASDGTVAIAESDARTYLWDTGDIRAEWYDAGHRRR